MSDRMKMVRDMALAGASRPKIAAAIGMSKTRLSILLQRHGIRTRGCGTWRAGNIEISPKAHPLVREMHGHANEQLVTLMQWSARSGIARDALSRWGHGQYMPKLDHFIAAANALGYEVVLREARE